MRKILNRFSTKQRSRTGTFGWVKCLFFDIWSYILKGKTKITKFDVFRNRRLQCVTQYILIAFRKFFGVFFAKKKLKNDFFWKLSKNLAFFSNFRGIQIPFTMCFDFFGSSCCEPSTEPQVHIIAILECSD